MSSGKYKVQYKKSVEKDLRKLPPTQFKSIVVKILALATDPHPSGSVKLRGFPGLFRIRHTDYRIIYRVHDDELVVLVVKVGHRREIYRDF
jgi:mRNA interferase RelE/StbE